MTKKELKELYYLQREIRNDEQRLMELEAAATVRKVPTYQPSTNLFYIENF